MQKLGLRAQFHCRAAPGDATLFQDEVTVGGTKVRPIDLTAALMFPKWTYQPGEQDLTVMRVIVEGTKAGKNVRFVWDLLDFFDESSGATSMSRTTAYPCTIMAKMIVRGEFRLPGVIPPELIGQQPGMLAAVLDQLRLRGVRYQASERAIG